LVILDVHKGIFYCYDHACLKAFRSRQEQEYAQGGDAMSVSSVLFESLFEGQLKNGSPTFMEPSVISELDSPKVYLAENQSWQFQDIKDDDLHFKVVFGGPDSSPRNALSGSIESTGTLSPQDHGNNSLSLDIIDEAGEYGTFNEDQITSKPDNNNQKEIVFKCDSPSVKGIWLDAATQCGRYHGSETSGSKIWGIVNRTTRLARKQKKKTLVANETRRALSLMKKSDNNLFLQSYLHRFHSEELASRNINEGKPIKVMPESRYKHVFMTKNEILAEMLQTSETFEDLRPQVGSTAIGFIQVEVLRCINLPKLDTLSKTDAVCYMVCGNYAFTTDVIDDTLNPVWPKRAKRAAIFPVFHAYAQLFVGVFDDDGKDENDDFAGRVVVDIARLRPGTMYDVTIPLRDSSFMYSTKTRGAIRLRFRLEFESDRAAVMSYIPNKDELKKIMKSDLVTTIRCADKKAFRNLAYTLHGKHLPGRYSSLIQRATLREFKMYRLLFIYLAKQVVVGVVTWENPFISLFIFLGYMLCIKVDSMASVPPFMVSIFLLFMCRNYAQSLNSMTSWGFDPLNIDELWNALLFGSCTKQMRPLNIVPNDDISPEGKIQSGKHLAFLTRLFIMIGFLDVTDMQGRSRINLDGMEFPHSFSDVYPKRMLKDCVSSEYEAEDEFKEDDDNKSQGSDTVQAGETTALVGKGVVEEKKTETIKSRIPHQDIGVAMKTFVPLSYDLLLVKAKMQKNFKYLFDDRVCYVKVDDDENKTRQMEYLLESEIGIHDYPNPITGKMADHISPVLGILKMFLGFCRGLTNILLWKDPYASFWICVFNLLFFLFLLVFPWRIFFFLVGFGALGPQNYFFKDTIKKKLLSIAKKAKFKAWKKKTNKKEKTEVLRKTSGITDNNTSPIFWNHCVSPEERKDTSNLALREVVVPYTRLRQYRFYDWPPDPTVSRAAEFNPQDF